MECAAPSSYLVTRPWKAFPSYRFRERRDRPLCHLMVRQQTWEESQNLDQSSLGCRCGNRFSDFQAWRLCQASYAGHQAAMTTLFVQLNSNTNYFGHSFESKY